MRRDVDDAIRRLAGRRAGAFHRDDVVAAGGDKYLARRRCRSGEWQQWWLDVFTLSSHPMSLDQLRWIGLLAAADGSHLSFESAAQLHQLAAIERHLVVVTTRRSHRIEIPGVRFHQLDDVLDHHRMTVDRFPTTTVARTLVDLAAAVRPTRLAAALEDAVVRRLVTFGDLHRVLGEVRRRGKPGVRTFVAVLDERDGEPLPESELERLLHEAAALARVTLVRQHPLPNRQGVPGVVDGAVLPSRLILEADGRRWHARWAAMAKDRHRDREAARLGWQTLRFVHEDLVNDLRGCADDIAATHAMRTQG